MSKKFKKPPWYVIVIAIVAVGIVVFAFVAEAIAKRDAETENGDFPASSSEIQNEIDGLDWIKQAPLPVNEYSRPGDKLDEVNGIVIHNIGNPGTTAMQNRNYFANLAITHETHASSNFIICLDGDIIQCVPVDEIAYASNERNADTLSIELCHPDDTGVFTDDTYDAAVRLTALLCDRHGLSSDDIIRHYDVRGKECPKYFVEDEGAWEAFKADVAAALQE